jgi:hypothetical protein
MPARAVEWTVRATVEAADPGRLPDHPGSVFAYASFEVARRRFLRLYRQGGAEIVELSYGEDHFRQLGEWAPDPSSDVARVSRCRVEAILHPVRGVNLGQVVVRVLADAKKPGDRKHGEARWTRD